MRPETEQRLVEVGPLLVALAGIGLAHGAAIGVEEPFPANSAPGRLEAAPGWSAALAAFLAVASVLAYRLDRRRVGARRFLGIATLAVGLAVVFFVGSPGGLLAFSGAFLLRPPSPPRTFEPVPAIAASPRVSWLAVALPLVAALAATSLTGSGWYGGLLPAASPQDRLLRAARVLSAAAVATTPAGRLPRALQVEPGERLDDLGRRADRERGGLTVAGVLEPLRRRGVLDGLPLTGADRVEPLLAPALASGLLESPDGRPLTETELWGIVVEAESRAGRRRLYLSLGLAPPSSRLGPRYELLFEVPAPGAAPVVIGTERAFPTASGFEGIAPAGRFLVYLLAFLVLSVIVCALRARRRTDTQRRGG